MTYAHRVTVLLVALAGCHSLRHADTDDAPVTQAAAADTVRGTVSLVGSEPMTEVVLAPVGGRAPIALAGAQRAMLRGLGGIEVVVRGRYTGERSGTAAPRVVAVFQVDSFEVRLVDGVAAADGIVAASDGKFFLVTTGGRRLAADHLPAALRQKIGARVFVAGPLDREAASYGVIQERP
jgi:hypothetical protein